MPFTVLATERIRDQRLRQFQAAHGASGGGEFVGLEGHALQHRDERVRERIIVLHVEREMLAVSNWYSVMPSTVATLRGAGGSAAIRWQATNAAANESATARPAEGEQRRDGFWSFTVNES